MKQKIMKFSVVFFLVFLMIFLANCTKKVNQISISNGEKIIKVNVEIADDNYERQQGLMFRESLNENDGMIFIFEDENFQSFWMKNTLIPLDIIFIDKNFEIVDIKNAVPCEEDPCAAYDSAKPAKYVLEINYGFAEKNSIEAGGKVDLKGILT